MRLTKTFDLPGVAAADDADADGPALDQHRGRLRQRDRRGAHGRRDELDDAAGRNGGTSNAVPAECEAGFLLDAAPVPAHYLTPAPTACTNTGTSGPWNAFTGTSGGWQDVGVRPVGVRRQAGRDLDLLRDRPGRPAASARSWMTRRSSSAARRPSRTGSRARRQHLDRPGRARRARPPNAGNWVIGPKAVNFYAGTSTRGHAAARLRARADHQPRRPRGADPPRAQRIGRALEQRLRQFLVVTGRLRPVTEDLEADVVRARFEVGADRSAIRSALPCGITASIRRSEPPSAMSCSVKPNLSRLFV